ncbi:hypothetical protein ABIG06_001041 [Bradyrhizobium sp. USDA 326]
MMDVTGLIICSDGVGTSSSPPAADVERTANESPYNVAVVRPLRCDVIGSRLTKFLQVIFSLRLLVRT